MNEEGLFPKNFINSKTILVSCLSEEFMTNSLKLASKLRENNIKTDLYPDNPKLKKQLQYANNNSIPYVVIIGEDEVKSNLFTLKNMVSGKQEKLSLEEIISEISS